MATETLEHVRYFENPYEDEGIIKPIHDKLAQICASQQISLMAIPTSGPTVLYVSCLNSGSHSFYGPSEVRWFVDNFKDL